MEPSNDQRLGTDVPARDALIRVLVDSGALHTPRVVDAFRAVPRHRFVPDDVSSFAYVDDPLPIGFGQTISQPTVVAMMTEALALRGDERVLEIGTGSGYQAAILSMLCREVYSIERVVPLADQARRTLQELGYRVQVRAGDGYLGWPEAAPFDRILLTAAPSTMPEALIEQLAEGGSIVAPVGEHGWTQELLEVRKTGGRTQTRALGGVRFVPMLPGVAS